MKIKFSLAVLVFTVVFGILFIVDGMRTYRPNLSAPTPALPPPIPPPDVAPPSPSPSTPLPDEIRELQVPIPHSMRVYNRSGSQCVWATIQALGNYHKVKGVQGLTDRYKHATGPGEVNRVLTARNVKFKQVNSRNNYDFIEEWVTQKKMGVGIGVGRHVILVCHFERGKLVKIIDNSDRQLRVQTWSWEKFVSRFDNWAFVILPDDYPSHAGWAKENNWDNGKVYH